MFHDNPMDTDYWIPHIINYYFSIDFDSGDSDHRVCYGIENCFENEQHPINAFQKKNILYNSFVVYLLDRMLSKRKRKWAKNLSRSNVNKLKLAKKKGIRRFSAVFFFKYCFYDLLDVSMKIYEAQQRTWLFLKYVNHQRRICAFTTDG